MKTYRLSVDTAYEADVSHVFLHLCLLVTKTGKSIDNDTENDVEEQHDDNHEEGEIIKGAQVINFFRFIEIWVRRQEVTNTTTSTKTEVKSWNVTMEETSAQDITFFDCVKLDIIIEVVVK